MNFDDYQTFTETTAQYPGKGMNLTCPILGLVGEAGEVAEKYKKVLRDHDGELSDKTRKELVHELGDVLWYVARVAAELDVKLSNIVDANVIKLTSRKDRNKIHGSGDNR